MTRPLRLQFPGAVYHVTCRGNNQQDIYVDRDDRCEWLEVVQKVCARFNFVVHAYCQMTNHFHMLIETVDGNLSDGMRHLNSAYSQYLNRRHGRVGHVLQGRYHAVLVQKDAYLLELARYIVLNPVRAGMVTSPDEWPWSSHHFIAGDVASPCWLDVEWLLNRFGPSRAIALRAYRQFLAEGRGLANPLLQAWNSVILGDDGFVAAHRGGIRLGELGEISKAQRRAVALSLEEYQMMCRSRGEAMARAYLSTAFSMAQIAAHFAVSEKTVARAVRAFEQSAQEPS